MRTSAGGVEECCLETHRAKVLEVVVNGNVDGVAEVRVHTGQGEQVRGTHKEVPMESVQAHTYTIMG